MMYSLWLFGVQTFVLYVFVLTNLPWDAYIPVWIGFKDHGYVSLLAKL